MKKLLIAAFAVIALSGCAQKTPGMCATSVNGQCLGRYDQNLNIVAVGGVDMRFTGVKCSNGGSGVSICSGTTSTKTVSYE